MQEIAGWQSSVPGFMLMPSLHLSYLGMNSLGQGMPLAMHCTAPSTQSVTIQWTIYYSSSNVIGVACTAKRVGG